MKRFRTLSILAILAAVGGCADQKPAEPKVEVNDEQPRLTDAQMVSTIRDQAVYNAIISQHTFYPYHFVANGDALNELGLRDLSALADYYRQHPGDVTVRRGDVSNDLYNGRVRQVVSALTSAGVDTNRVKVSDTIVSGEGMPSDRVVKILNAREKGAKGGDSTGTTESKDQTGGSNTSTPPDDTSTDGTSGGSMRGLR